MRNPRAEKRSVLKTFSRSHTPDVSSVGLMSALPHVLRLFNVNQSVVRAPFSPLLWILFKINRYDANRKFCSYGMKDESTCCCKFFVKMERCSVARGKMVFSYLKKNKKKTNKPVCASWWWLSQWESLQRRSRTEPGSDRKLSQPGQTEGWGSETHAPGFSHSNPGLLYSIFLFVLKRKKAITGKNSTCREICIILIIHIKPKYMQQRNCAYIKHIS